MRANYCIQFLKQPIEDRKRKWGRKKEYNLLILQNTNKSVYKRNFRMRTYVYINIMKVRNYRNNVGKLLIISTDIYLSYDSNLKNKAINKCIKKSNLNSNIRTYIYTCRHMSRFELIKSLNFLRYAVINF